jgi:type II secretory pathway component PulM
MSTEAWLTGRRGQALAAAIGCLALILIWVGLINPLWSWFDNRSMLLEQHQALLYRLREISATLPALRAAAARNPNQALPTETLMLPGTNDAVAAADLQERIQKMATAAGVNLTAVETLPASPAGSWHKVSLRISMNAPWPVLMDLVRSIEQSPVRILIDDVHFHSATVINRPTVLPIQASMVVYAFRSAESSAGT